MRNLTEIELGLVVGGAGEPSAAAPICQNSNNNNTAMITCVVGDQIVTTACITTAVDGKAAGEIKLGPAVRLEGKLANTSCATTITNAKTGSVTTTGNNTSRSMPGKRGSSDVNGDYLYYRDVGMSE